VCISRPSPLPVGCNVSAINLPVGLATLRGVRLPHKLGFLERLYGRILAKNGVCWVKCSNGVEWRLDLADATQRWIVYGDYEGSIFLNWMRSWMKPGGVFVDSGANIGQILLYIAPLPDVQGIAFEPLPEAMRWLEECVDRYSDEWQVTLIEKGLSDQSARVELQRSGPQSTMRNDWYQEKGLERVSAEVDTLDNQLHRLAIDHVRLWKLDVEGFEIAALRGAERSLARSLIDGIVIEVCPPNLGQVKSLLAQADYELFSLGSDGKLRDPPRTLDGTTNLLALSPTASAAKAK
jgi:FkbM family methyltransferase